MKAEFVILNESSEKLTKKSSNPQRKIPKLNSDIVSFEIIQLPAYTNYYLVVTTAALFNACDHSMEIALFSIFI